ncbi:MAG: hypothetical protein ACE5KM_19330 [Planctomycetaceae bacterium]
MITASALLFCRFVAFVIAGTDAATEESTNQKTEKANQKTEKGSATKTQREQWAEPGSRALGDFAMLGSLA